MSNYSNGYAGLLQWLRNTHPSVYERVKARSVGSGGVNGLAGMADIAEATPVKATAAQTIVDTIRNAAQAFIPLYTQKKVLDMQLKRAKAGLPPLDTAQYTDDAAYKVGMNESTQSTLLKMVGIAGAALLAFRLLGRRRS